MAGNYHRMWLQGYGSYHICWGTWLQAVLADMLWTIKKLGSTVKQMYAKKGGPLPCMICIYRDPIGVPGGRAFSRPIRFIDLVLAFCDSSGTLS